MSEPLGNATTQQRFTRREVLRGALLASGAAALAACGTTSDSAPPSASSKPKRGGNLRVGFTGGSSSDTLDADNPITYIDHARGNSLYNALVTRGRSSLPELELAEEITPTSSDATKWLLRLRSGVTFHNGKPLTVDDVIFTIKRIVNPKSPLAGAGQLAPIDVNSFRKQDDLAMTFETSIGYASLVQQLSTNVVMIVPVGYDPKRPIGTGPFKFSSFAPGVQSVFVRNDDYWKSGLPYVDQLTVSDFADSTSQVNALLSATVDAIGNIPYAGGKELASSSANTLLNSESGAFTPFTMRVDQPPFNDVRVRQAMRLIVDRPQLIDSALDGYGQVGNDVFSLYDPDRDTSLVRSQDIPQARSLLKKAGREDLTVQLVTSDIANGAVGAATVFAQQASAAGVKVVINEVTGDVIYGPNYLKWPFSQDYWLTSLYLTQVSEELLPTSPYNEPHWNDSHYTGLYYAANATTDDTRRRQLIQDMQSIDFDSGGLIVPSFNNNVDAYSNKVHGFLTSRTGAPFNNFRFDLAWME